MNKSDLALQLRLSEMFDRESVPSPYRHAPSPAVAAFTATVESQAKINSENAAKARKTITEAEFVAALDEHIRVSVLHHRHPADKGWKGGIAHALGIDRRTLRYPPGWDEQKILDFLEAA